MKLQILISIFSLALATFGCSSDDGDSHDHNHGSHTSDDAGADGHDHPPTDDSKLCDDKADEFSVKLAKDTKDQKFNVQFVAADPAPPDVGKNSWTVKVTDAKGEVVEGAAVIAEPVMPHHGHGTFPESWEFKAGDKAGEYTVSGMDLFMSGYWETTLTIADKDGNTDTVMFIFCLEG